MFKNGAETRHSKTALITTLCRAVASKEFQNQRIGSDYLAEYFLPFHMRFLIQYAKIRARGRAKEKIRTPGVYEYMLARTAFFDKVFVDALNESIPQIVLLGAGYDTRAYRFADLNKATRIMELDMAATQKRKLKCITKFRMDIPQRLTYAAIDFNRESLKDVLENAGYDDNRKTLFLWEGVCMYLQPESVDNTLRFVADSSNDESVIVFDYAVSISDYNSNPYYGAKELSRKMKRPGFNETIEFTIDEKKTASFLDQRGLKMVEHLDHQQLEKMFLLKDDGTVIGRPNGVFRIVTASPKHNP